MTDIAHDRADPASTQALSGFRGMVGLTLCGQTGEQMVHASEVCGVVDFHTPTVTAASLMAGDGVDLSSIQGPQADTTGPQIGGPRQTGRGHSFS